MKQTWYFLSSLLFLLYLGQSISWAQDDEPEKAPLFSEFMIGLDVLKPLSFASDFEEKLEGEVGVMFRNKLMILAELGYGILSPKNAYRNADYTSSGTYFRIGADYFSPLSAQDRLFFGLRYGQAAFEDQYSFIIKNTLWNDYQSETVVRPNQQAHWMELVIGSDRKVNDWLSYGVKIRLRNMLKFDQVKEPVKVYTIPGYGYPDYRIMPAFNAFIRIRLGGS